MLESMFLACFWLPTPLALGGYFVSRRRLRHSRWLTLFDCVVVALGVAICAAFFWPDITGQRHDDGEGIGIGIFVVPAVIAIVFVPLLAASAIIRYFIFSQPSEH